jgi:peptide/nickel transport system substrate-binding protein
MRRVLSGVLLATLTVGGITLSRTSALAADANTLVVAQGVGPTTMNPLSGETIPLVNHYRQVFDALTVFDDKLKLQPALATSWRLVNETTWEFKLREGVKFHNGEEFTAQAVKFTWDRVLDPAQKSTKRPRLPHLTRIDVVDPVTVRLITAKPFPLLPGALSSLFIVPPRYTQEKGDAHAGANPVGTGPYKFLRWVKDDRIEFEANPQYWGGAPRIARLVMRSIPESATRVAALQTGEVDLITNLPPNLQAPIKNAASLTTVTSPIAVNMIIELDTLKAGPIANKKVRQALNHAVDKQAIIQHTLEGLGRPAKGQTVPPEAFGHHPSLTDYPFDPAAARRLLAEAGYPNGFSMTIASGDGRYLLDKEVAQAIAGQLNQVGVNAKVNLFEWGVYVQHLGKKTLGDGFFIGWYALPVPDAAQALAWYTSDNLYAYWKNPDFDQIFVTLSTSLVEADRLKAAHRAIEIMREEAPMIFLYQAMGLYGASKRITGWNARLDDILSFTSVTKR